jgi:hypothetical protein
MRTVGAAHRTIRWAALAASLLLAPSLLTACGGDDDGQATTAPSSSSSVPATSVPAPAGPAGPAAEGLTQPLPPAPALPTATPAGPEPVSLTIDDLSISSAVVRPVGVEPDGEMEVPPADEVGWYRYGPRPGDEGSSVLAAHIAYGGEDGVFRHLADLPSGATLTVAYADGTTRQFQVTEVANYPKDSLPPSTWTREGPATLSLITCGGEFDESTGHYTDNVIAHTTPV